MASPHQNRLRREQRVFADALGFPPGPDREAFLDGACDDDAELRKAVETLLRHHSEGAVGDPAPNRTPLSKRVGLEVTVQSALVEGEGTSIGHYKLLEQLGEGGMGVVYMAQQDEPVRRRVALKIIRLGMDTREVVARFEAERQALAMMDHPNIARVLDAGATSTGRPFFVMELVKGIPITQYCDHHRLDPGQRLDLFLQVCSAIQHAHQKGVIHRDIKPSNVLVALHDGQPTAKVIDFGIAKATGARLTTKTLFTAFEQIVGTPAYMSPEQAGLSGLDIDTRSDIYSLGVLLYELLAGRPPFDPRSLLNVGPDEIRRVIRDVEPPLPSRKFAALAADEAARIGKNRRLDTRRLTRVLQGDLDHVVMKAMEKDRSRRYASAEDLGADIRRYLRHEPVMAVAPSTSYKMARFVRRNRVPVAIACTIVVLLVAGVATSTWFAIAANISRQAALREAAQRAQVARFLQEMLESVRPAKARGRDTAMLLELLDSTANRLGADLKAQPDVEFALRGTLGRTYEALGVLTNAEAMQRRALELSRKLDGPVHTNVAQALLDLGITLTRQGRFPEATDALKSALQMNERLVGPDHPMTAGPLNWLGNVHWLQGRHTNAEPLLLRTLKIRRQSLGRDHSETLSAEVNLASMYYEQGRTSDLEPLLTEAVGRLRASLGVDHPTTLNAMNLMAILRQSQGRFREAEALHTEVLDSKRRVLGPQHLFTLTSMDNLGIVYGFEGRYEEAGRICREALEGYEPKMGAQHRNTLAMKSNLAEYLRNQGRFEEAEQLFRRIMEVQGRTMPPGDSFRLETLAGYGILHALKGEAAQAESVFQEILEQRRATLRPGDPGLADAINLLVQVRLARGQGAAAEPLAREAFEINRKNRPEAWQTWVSESQLGGCLDAAGRRGEAEPLLRHAAEELRKMEDRIPAIDRLRIGEAAQRLADFCERTGPAELAAAWRREAARHRPPSPRPALK